MATNNPIIQILSRNNYEVQHLVSLPKEFPLPPLASSSIRVKPSILSLTANNLTYGRIGHILGIWQIYPLPPSVPTEYTTPDAFGRIAAWGYATVTESNVPLIELGSQVFGLLPIGTLPVDLQVQVNSESRFLEISAQRESVMPLYNEYMFYPPMSHSTSLTEHKQSQGYDALFQIFFTTSYLMNRFTFPWDAAEFVHPGAVDDNWTLEKGSIDDKATVLIFADSGKTALAFAYLLKQRPAGAKPRLVIGIGSSASRAFVEETKMYDKTLTYDSDSGDLDLELGLNANSKVVIVEFGSRGGAGDRWERKLRQTHDNVVQLIVAGEVMLESPEKATERFLARTKNDSTVFNASKARVQAMEVIGEKRYSEELEQEWKLFKEGELVNVKGFKMVWGNGMEALGEGWDMLCKGEVGADQGLVFSLDL